MSFVNRKEVRRSNILMLLEALLTAYVGYLSFGIVGQYVQASSVSFSQLITFIGLFSFFVILSALSVGLYESKLRETFRGIIRRIFVSVAIGYFVMEILGSTLLSHITMHQYFLPITAGLTILLIVTLRYFIIRLGLLGLGQTKIIVIGAGERASIIEKRMRREVDRFGFELLGFIPIPGDNREEGIQNEKLVHVKIDENFRNFIADNDIDEVV
ncbi:MAG: FlaA1/EpsC-like NDP-sugar epimerase, partial [Desulforhopalus sp.]